MRERFDRFAASVASWFGHPVAFIVACFGIIAWSLTGPFCDFSNGWQLVANTVTTIITFLMMFLLQNTGNRTIGQLTDQIAALQAQQEKIIALLEHSVNPMEV